MAQVPAVAATLDAVGLPCPLPVLKARRALASLASGDVLEVFASDPGTAADLEAFCRMTGHRLLGQTSEVGVNRFLIEKAGSGGEDSC